MEILLRFLAGRCLRIALHLERDDQEFEARCPNIQ